MLKTILTLSKLPGIGPKTIRQIKLEYDLRNLSDLALFELLKDAKQKIKRLKLPSKEDFEISVERTRKLIERLEIDKISCFIEEENDYPESFKSLSSPPILIFAKGHIDLLNHIQNLQFLLLEEMPLVLECPHSQMYV